jgi:PAS domain S-box-containing protein
VFANDAYCRHFKKRGDEIIGHRFVPSIPDEDRERVRSHFASFTLDHPVADIEHRVMMPDGVIHWHWWNDHAIFDDTGRIIEYQSIGKDITDRKRVEEELKQSENLYRTIFTTTGAATIIIAPDTTILLANKGWEELTGLPRSEQENKLSWTVFFDKDDGERMVRYHQARRNDPSLAPSVYESRLVDIKKRVHTCYVYVEMIPGTKNSVASLVDITDQKKAEEALQKSEERYRSVVNDQTEMIVRFAADGTVTFTNEAMRSYYIPMLGLDEVVGKNISDLMRTEDFGEMKNVITSLTPETPIREVERRVAGRDRETYWQRWSVRALFDNGGNPAEYQIVGRDITEQKRSSAELADSESRLRSFIETTQESVALVDEDGKMVEWNQASERITGIRKDEALGRYLWDLTFRMLPREHRTEEHRLASEQATRTMLMTGVPVFKGPRIVEAERPDGTRLFTRQTIFPIRTHKGFRFGSISQDITEEKRSEGALLQANKKLSLLSGITRHDINNQLVVLNGFVGLLERNNPDPAYKDFFSRITKASSQIAAMIRFTREYEKIGTESPVWQDLETVLNRAEKGIIPGQIAIRNDLLAGTEVFADPLIVRVFFNLLDNSLRHGERVTEIHVSSHLSKEDLVVVWEDNGVGIPDEDKERIFERGFGKNTGLGMFLVREILSLTGITIAETGDPGYGVRFEMVVPKGMWCEAGDRET